ncbi:TetR/AcrR family transcriptional regulator [bacterium]|nr:TetR/AcrR family transcriptional regulator [bacterium]
MSDDTATYETTKFRRLPEERPGQILDAAVKVFTDRGIAAAKLEEIAALAGVSKGTIYLYFPSKEELFREVVRQKVVPFLARADEAQAAESATAALSAYLESHWRYMDRDDAEGWVRLALLELHKFPDLAQFYRDEVVNRSNAVLIGIIERGIASGEFRPTDADAAVMMIKGILLTHVIWCGAHSPNPAMRAKPREQILHDITDFVLHALRPVTPVAATVFE